LALAKQPARPARDGGRTRDDAGVPFLTRHAAARLFRFHDSGHLRDLLKQAMKAAGLSFPRRQGGFHIFCHTYGTWMSRYGELDTFGLTRTDRWAEEFPRQGPARRRRSIRDILAAQKSAVATPGFLSFGHLHRR